MKKRILRYVKHISITFVILAAMAISFGLYHGASFRYAENPEMMNWDKDGPYIFNKNDSVLSVNYIRGNQDDGFYLDQKEYASNSKIPAYCYFPLDSTRFEFYLDNTIIIPRNTYDDKAKILAISDIESGFRTFRDFLIANKVIDKKLNWSFGNGHLVLLGDFVDRDFSTTQVLWFIYKLEQEANEKGGTVHFILGNHELKNMQGNFESTSPKYYHVASILKKRQTELYDKNSFLGRWMSSKNTIEKINGILFSHGGLHSDLGNYKIDLDEVNQIIRNNYYKPYYPNPRKNIEQLLISSHKGIAWYRGYFKDDLAQEDVERNLNKFDAKAIVVGHTLQPKVNSQFNKKVIGIDVKHPKDYSKSFPNQESEGLLIEGNNYYRVLHNGEMKKI
ncbi:metallophosphoesterase [Flavobacterium gelatinilyticum]|uniref:metallophosphoesterase n=1 Tax=Flavobacterium gelatinilyticum TaxID=3003260 RepID=UPI0024800A8D|nr:metallophosphoesterase [Flavobacterium gelatinilyticum]